MKASCVCAMISAILSLSPFAAGNAQQLGCGPWLDPCDQATWQGPATISMTVLGSCDIDIEYRWRDGCGFYDVELVSITPRDGDCSGFDNAATFVQIIRNAAFEVIFRNPMGFPPSGPDQCVSTYRTYLSSCWGRYRNEADGPPYVRGCGLNCCRNRFQVCTDSNGRRYISQTYDQDVLGALTCDHAVAPNELSCVPVCDVQ